MFSKQIMLERQKEKKKGKMVTLFFLFTLILSSNVLKLPNKLISLIVDVHTFYDDQTTKQ